MSKILLVLKSRKFWACVVGIAVIVIKAYNPTFPIGEDQILTFVILIVSYILGTSIEDAGRALANALPKK